MPTSNDVVGGGGTRRIVQRSCREQQMRMQRWRSNNAGQGKGKNQWLEWQRSLLLQAVAEGTAGAAGVVEAAGVAQAAGGTAAALAAAAAGFSTILNY